MKISLITGPAGAIQGWGDMKVTERIKEALEYSGNDVEVLYVSEGEELVKRLKESKPDIAWSSINFVSDNPYYMGGSLESNVWVGDILEVMGVPYVGSSKETLNMLLDKKLCQQALIDRGVPIPYFHQVVEGDALPNVVYPVIVKPTNEANSRGIDESSVVNDDQALEERIRYIHQEFHQPAFVEEYLPGREITVPVLGNDEKLMLPLDVKVNQKYVKKHSLLTCDIKSHGLVKGSVILSKLSDYDIARANELAKTSVETFGCKDSVRVDMREDRYGNLKVIEINGVPGLKPEESYKVWSFYLYNPLTSKKENYTMMINTIIGEALKRNEISVPDGMKEKMFANYDLLWLAKTQ